VRPILLLVAILAGLVGALNPGAGIAYAAPVAKPPAKATFGIGPVTLGKSGARGFFSYQMGVGGSYSDRVAVLNYSQIPLALTIYAAELNNDDNGAIGVDLPTAPLRDAAAWVNLAKRTQTVQVAPATKKGPGRVELPFRVVVPDDAVPGDHAAAIVATLSTVGKNPKGQNVRLDQRVATRMYLRVAGPLHPHLSIENLTAKYRGTLNPIGRGTATVSYTVHNTGNVRLAARQVVSVTGMFGTTSKAVTPEDITMLLPGGSSRITVEVGDVLPTIWHKAKVTVTPMLFNDQAVMPVPVSSQSASFTAVPWSLLGCVLLLVVLLIAVLLWRLRRKRAVPVGGRHGGNPLARTPQGVGS
jgi:hypothetical protein